MLHEDKLRKLRKLLIEFQDHYDQYLTKEQLKNTDEILNRIAIDLGEI